KVYRVNDYLISKSYSIYIPDLLDGKIIKREKKSSYILINNPTPRLFSEMNGVIKLRHNKPKRSMLLNNKFCITYDRLNYSCVLVDRITSKASVYPAGDKLIIQNNTNIIILSKMLLL